MNRGRGRMPTVTQDRRKLGTSIKFGLDELRNLDAKPVPPSTHEARAKRSRTETAASARDEAQIESSAGVFGSWREWAAVKDLLFPLGDVVAEGPRAGSLRAAHAMLNLWKLRSRPALRTGPSAPAAAAVPPYVECSVMLLEAQHFDSHLHMEGGRGTEDALTSLVAGQYCSAVLRAVHMMTGSIITARSFRDEQTTYRERAKQINFPEEAVDVRQRITHGAVPPLNELRWVCSLLLHSLYVQFWLPQSQHISVLMGEDASREEAVLRSEARKRKREEAARKHASTADMYALLDELEASPLPEGSPATPLAPEVTAAGWLVEKLPSE